MPNIDTSTIEGFETMSAEDKVTALLAYEIPDAPDLSGYVEKTTFDAKASEAARLSKALTAKTKEAETATAALTPLQAELEALKHTQYIAGKGVTGEDAEFVAFKATKLVDDKTTFEQAVDKVLEGKKQKTFDWGGSLGGGSNEDKDTNKTMNAFLRNAFQ